MPCDLANTLESAEPVGLLKKTRSTGTYDGILFCMVVTIAVDSSLLRRSHTICGAAV